MKLALLILAFGSLAAAEEFTFIGTIDKLARSEISVKTQRGSFKIYADDKTELVKDKSYHDFSPLKTGDEISVRCQPDTAGKLIAVKVWANIVSLAATVKELQTEQIEVVVTSSDAAGGDQSRIVRLYPDTVFGTNKADVAVGQRLRIVGLDVGNGTVDAARIALYNTDVPARRD